MKTKLLGTVLMSMLIYQSHGASFSESEDKYASATSDLHGDRQKTGKPGPDFSYKLTVFKFSSQADPTLAMDKSIQASKQASIISDWLEYQLSGVYSNEEAPDLSLYGIPGFAEKRNLGPAEFVSQVLGWVADAVRYVQEMGGEGKEVLLANLQRAKADLEEEGPALRSGTSDLPYDEVAITGRSYTALSLIVECFIRITKAKTRYTHRLYWE
ncbi:MAG: hypothetical protein LBI20_01870 [Holosporales bacterium]|jgi:hypothetical protein|nr:hypothetical protein [Holosporales bacterium]